MLCFRIDLLDVVLPTLVAEKTANVPEKEITNEAENGQNKEVVTAPDPLTAATSAAISAINSVAAASRNKSLKSTPLLNGKSASKTGMNGVLPVMNDSRETSVTGNKTDAAKTVKLTPSDIMVFKQEPSTSSDKDNMVLACSGDAFNRCGIP